jgi:GntR family transcriptional regulator, transcriptional repressor for pyruvate dehydrogenase complex
MAPTLRARLPGLWEIRRRSKIIEQRFTLLELLEARRLIEPSLATLAAARSTEEHLGAMEQALKGMYSNNISPEEHLRFDELFHRAIVDATDNPLLSQMMDLIWAPLLETFRITDHSTKHLENDNHQQVYLAIKAKGRQGARKAMLAVLKQTERDLLKREKK